MFTSNVKKSVQVSVLFGALMASVTAHAEAAPVSDVMSAIEQTLSTQAQELLVNTKRELVLSLQTQLASFYLGKVEDVIYQIEQVVG